MESGILLGYAVKEVTDEILAALDNTFSSITETKFKDI